MKDFSSRYGFHVPPFTSEIPVDKHFSLPFLEEAVEGVVRTVERRQCAAVIAPPGTGKTAVIRKARAKLPEARNRVQYVHVTGLSKRELCREICAVLGISSCGIFPMLVRRIQEYFLAISDTDALRPVLILDEAHEIKPDVLGLLRVLTNFDMDSRLVVSIILVGQTPLRDTLRRDDMEDVARRLDHCATLRPLSQKETQDYIKHRCSIAGARTVPFDADAITAIYEVGRGNMRATDHLAVKTLEVAHLADCKVASSTHVQEASKVLWP
jgi:general secretion pathway protein A